MADKQVPQAYILRLGPAARRSGEAKVRWVYAIQCTDEAVLRQQFARIGSAATLGAREIQQLLATLPADTILAGPGEIQSAAKSDPGLRRALRAAREGLRQELALSPENRMTERDKGAG